MKKNAVLLLALAFLLAFSSNSRADTLSVPCLYQPDKGCNPVSKSNPLPVATQTPVTLQGATVGTSAGNIAAAGSSNWTYVYLGNPNSPGGPTVWCAFGGTVAVAQAAGTVELASGQVITFGDPGAPQGPISCISSSASTAFTYGVK